MYWKKYAHLICDSVSYSFEHPTEFVNPVPMRKLFLYRMTNLDIVNNFINMWKTIYFYFLLFVFPQLLYYASQKPSILTIWPLVVYIWATMKNGLLVIRVDIIIFNDLFYFIQYMENDRFLQVEKSPYFYFFSLITRKKQ